MQAPFTLWLAQAADAAAAAPAEAVSLPFWWYLAPIGAVLALVMAFVFYKSVMSNSEGDENMIRIAASVRAGAYAYLSSQAKVVYSVVAGLVVVLLIMGFADVSLFPFTMCLHFVPCLLRFSHATIKCGAQLCTGCQSVEAVLTNPI